MIYINLLLAVLFISVSAIGKAGMDILQFKYHDFKFKDKLNPNFWNPSISWKNKYKNLDVSQGEKFLGSTTIFVFLTDGWHLCQFVFLNSLFISALFLFPLYSANLNLITISILVVLRIVFGLVFTLFYKKIFIKNGLH